MQDLSSLLTVAQLAQAAGVTKQAVYKRLSKDLAPYVTVINGQKYLSPAAASLFAPAPDAAAAPAPAADTVLVDVLQAQIDTLTAQLAEKDKQIDRLQATIEAQTQAIAQQTQLQLIAFAQPRLDPPADDNSKSDKQPSTSWFSNLIGRISRH
jgi:septal ring factor EnvC (AmiA/AmiB activator)